MADLKLTDVAKVYGGGVEVLKNINLDIQEGELIVFVGPSGCGKSTLLRMIAGLEKISGGTLEIGGQVVNDIPPAQRGIAMVFQSYALYPHMTVRDNMSFALKLAKKSASEIDAAVTKAAKILQLEPYLDLLSEVEQVLVMTVEPGFGGQAFMSDMMAKVSTVAEHAKTKGLDLWIQVDGGISVDTIALAARAGANTFVAGSSVYATDVPPGDAIERLRNAAISATSDKE